MATGRILAATLVGAFALVGPVLAILLTYWLTAYPFGPQVTGNVRYSWSLNFLPPMATAFVASSLLPLGSNRRRIIVASIYTLVVGILTIPYAVMFICAIFGDCI